MSFAKRFAEHDARRDRADECDLCLANGVTVFSQFSTAFNGAMFYGDCCDTCRLAM
jgi:hypothetical protein